MRQQGEDKISTKFWLALSELQVSQLSQKSWELLCTCIANRLSPDKVAAFDPALQLYFTTEEVKETNFDKLVAANMPVKKILAYHKSQNAAKATEDKADNLCPDIHECIGAWVMLTTNLWTKIGLVNGSIGSIYNITQDTGQDPSSSMLSLVFIKFDKYKKPDFLKCLQGIVPIFPATCQFEFKRVVCSYTQFPLQLAYAITVYKSQGLTLSRVALNLNQREHCLGLSYIAVSQVKTLDGALFEVSFDFEHFIYKDAVVSQERKLDYIFRNRQLLQLLVYKIYQITPKAT